MRESIGTPSRPISWLGPDRNGLAQHAFELLVLLAIQKPEEIFEEAIDALFDASKYLHSEVESTSGDDGTAILAEDLDYPGSCAVSFSQDLVGRDAVDLKTLRESMYECELARSSLALRKGTRIS